jgi:hypothetical protein
MAHQRVRQRLLECAETAANGGVWTVFACRGVVTVFEGPTDASGDHHFGDGTGMCGWEGEMRSPLSRCAWGLDVVSGTWPCSLDGGPLWLVSTDMAAV